MSTISLVGLKELKRVARSGTKIRTDPRINRMYLPIKAFLSSCFIVLLLLNFKFLRYSQLDDRNHYNQEEQDYGNGIGITELVIFKGIVINQESK